MRRVLLTVATAAASLAATACGDITGVRDDVAGIYELRTIDGRSLPATFSDEFGSVTYLVGELELDRDGTFVDTYQYRVSGNPFVETEQIFGTWDYDGDEIRFEATNGRVYFMERTSADRLVYRATDGSRWVYERF